MSYSTVEIQKETRKKLKALIGPTQKMKDWVTAIVDDFCDKCSDDDLKRIVERLMEVE